MAATRVRVRGASVSGPARSRGPAVGNVRAGAQVSDIQRARLLAAAVGAIDERGYAHTTVAHVTERARVSRRTFYELFADREDCLLATIDSAVEQVRAQIAHTGLAGVSWRERMRGGVGSILSFFDRDPALARVCVVQSSGAGPRVLERRAQILSEIALAIDGGRTQGVGAGGGVRGGDCSALTAEGLAGAALSILYTRLSRREDEPHGVAGGGLSELAGELTAMIVLPYEGRAVARKERERPLSTPGWGAASSSRSCPSGVDPERDALPVVALDPLGSIPMRLTYRTARVLEMIAEHPGICNRELGERAGIADQGQTSKLLARLERYGLLENRGAGYPTGEPNAWLLTVAGRQVTQTIAQGARYRTRIERANV